MIEAIACAKVNFSLRVRPPREDGLHPIGGLFQSIGWVDRVGFEWGDEDSLVSANGGPVIAGRDNLVWKATELVRGETASDRRVHISLAKAIPAAAGLGGGSADGATALAVVGRMFGVEATTSLASRLGSDVPFCLIGGAADVGGIGDVINSRVVPAGFALGLVVPPVELSTAAVFKQWDAMGSPAGSPVGGPGLPPALRGDEPLVNDLHPAAAVVAPKVEEWRHELQLRWGRPVLLTGSGPALFAFFVDSAEALAALESIPTGARAAVAAEPVPFGWAARENDSSVWSYAALDEPARDVATRLFDG